MSILRIDAGLVEFERDDVIRTGSFQELFDEWDDPAQLITELNLQPGCVWSGIPRRVQSGPDNYQCKINQSNSEVPSIFFLFFSGLRNLL